MKDRKLYNIQGGEGWIISYSHLKWLNKFCLFETMSIIDLKVTVKDFKDEKNINPL